MAASCDDNFVVVWEWRNSYNHWIPYDANVSNFLEGERGNKERIQLGAINRAMTQWTVDAVKMMQTNSQTGCSRPVRRQLYPSTCPLANGIAWQWLDNDSSWIIYDPASCQRLEDAYQQQQKEVDLVKDDGSTDYLVNLDTMVQTRKNTGYCRHLRRNSDFGNFTAVSKKAEDLASTSGKDGKKGKGNRGLLRKLSFTKDLLSGKKKSGMKTSKSVDAKLSSSTSNGTPTSPNAPVMTVKKSKSFIHPVVSGMTSLLMSPVTKNYQPLTPSDGSSGTKSPSKHKALDQGGKNAKRKKAKKSKVKAKDTTAEATIARYSDTNENDVEDEVDCNICYEKTRSLSGFSADPVLGHVTCRLARCQHMFHKACLLAMYDSGTKDGSLQCPSCKMIYGEKFGNCPAGRMEIDLLQAPLPGYTCDTIRIIYSIAPGVQGANHPNPGRPYTARGFPRHCYLPNDKRGRQVMSLLKLAWERRLTFTIGNSATTGEENTVTWNEIHHKTEFRTNYSGHGYPDDKYLDNVTEELALQGITPDLLG